MESKRIIFVIDNLGSGGAQKQLYLIASGLVKQGFKVYVYCYDDYGKDFYTNHLEAIGIKVIKQVNQNYMQRIITLRRYLKQELPSTVISFLYGANILSALVKILSPRNFRLIVSDRTGVAGAITVKDRIRFQLYRSANTVLANSSHTARKIVERAPWLRSKTKVIWNMIQPLNGDILKKENELVFLLGARYHSCKNHAMFLKAFILALGRHTDPNTIRLKCFGNKLGELNRDYIESLKQLVRNSDFSAQIELNDETLHLDREILASDICVLPSLWEGCPNFAIEGMSAGKVVLLSNVCSNPDILTADGEFLFNPESVEDMCEKLLHVMTLSRQDRMEIGDFNKRKAKSMFDSVEILREFIEIIV